MLWNVILVLMEYNPFIAISNAQIAIWQFVKSVKWSLRIFIIFILFFFIIFLFPLNFLKFKKKTKNKYKTILFFRRNECLMNALHHFPFGRHSF